MENFIEEEIKKYSGSKEIITRFPPENNGRLHLGHVKAIYTNFTLGEKHGVGCNLRFDDSNPSTSKEEYANFIKEDLEWLGLKPREIYYASNYFSLMHVYAQQLISQGDAYVCDLSSEEIAEYRGVPTRDGKESPYRNRTVEENLELFADMTVGKYEEGEKVLRLKIDMTSPNLHMRDPIAFRIKKTPHYNVEAKSWSVYPMYDYAHCISDSIENITHSLCTLEFEVHRPLYDWILEKLNIHRPRQIEFARLNVDYTVMSKRRLKQLVDENYVEGWDDPRMPTIAGMRRRGYTPTALFNFMDKVGITKRESIADVKLLESAVRDDLNKTSERRMGVLRPLKLTVTNAPKMIEWLPVINNPEDEDSGERSIAFSKNLWIEKDDFRIEANSKYKRMTPDRYIRLKYAYIVKCTGYKTDENGEVCEVLCEYIPESKSGSGYTEIKPKGTIHFVADVTSINATVRLYDRLFKKENPLEDEDFKSSINENSLEVLENCKIENSLQFAKPFEIYQFERLGYFCVDKDSKSGDYIFNRTIELRSNWK